MRIKQFIAIIISACIFVAYMPVLSVGSNYLAPPGDGLMSLLLQTKLERESSIETGTSLYLSKKPRATNIDFKSLVILKEIISRCNWRARFKPNKLIANKASLLSNNIEWLMPESTNRTMKIDRFELFDPDKYNRLERAMFHILPVGKEGIKRVIKKGLMSYAIVEHELGKIGKVRQRIKSENVSHATLQVVIRLPVDEFGEQYPEDLKSFVDDRYNIVSISIQLNSDETKKVKDILGREPELLKKVFENSSDTFFRLVHECYIKRVSKTIEFYRVCKFEYHLLDQLVGQTGNQKDEKIDTNKCDITVQSVVFEMKQEDPSIAKEVTYDKSSQETQYSL